jgi:uncharacterized protein (UPF0276 family)
MNQLPKLGVGLGFREEMRSAIFLHREQIDFLEITADHYLGATGRKLQELDVLRQHFRLVPHSLDLSLGSAEGLDSSYVEMLAELVDAIDPPWISDHICFTRSGGRRIGHLAPVPFTREAIDVLVRNINVVKEKIRRPLVLENITYNLRYASSEMTEGEFLRTVLDDSDCGMLLDVTNLYINSVNLGYDWRDLLDQLPLDRVVQVHFVGSRRNGDFLVDAHADKTESEIWNVFREVCVRCDIKGAILERDEDFPGFAEIVSELEMARSIISSTDAERSRVSYVLS